MSKMICDGSRCEGFHASDCVVSTTCARCSAPLEVTDATVDDVVKAHEARCFVRGDAIRWEDPGSDRWVDGTYLKAALLVGQVWIKVSSTNTDLLSGEEQVVLSKNIRRIPRPEQAVKPCTGTWTHAEPLLYYCSQEYGHPGNCYDYPPSRSEPLYREADPLDVKYDGVTLRDIVVSYELLQREHHLVQRNSAGDIVRYGESMPRWFMCQNGEFTAAQRAAVSSHWSAELRSRVAASKGRERLTVMIDLQDEP